MQNENGKKDQKLPPAKTVGQDSTVRLHFAIRVDKSFWLERKWIWVDSLIMRHSPYIGHNRKP